MKPALQITESLERAAEVLRTTRSELGVVKAAVRQSADDLSAAKSKLSQSTADLQTTESDLALGRPADTGAARKRFLLHRDAVDFTAARASGLAPRLTQAEQDEAAAAAEFDQEWRRFAASTIENFLLDYSEAAEELYSVMDQGLAIAAAFTPLKDANRLAYHLGQTQVRSLRGQKSEFFRDRAGWKDNAAALELHQAIAFAKARLLTNKIPD